MLNGEKLQPSLKIDLELEPKDIDISLVEEVSKLEPFGASNPSPTFVIKNQILKQKKLMGSNKDHLKLIIDTPNGSKDCVWWSRGDIPLIQGDRLDIAFAPQLNTFNGTTDIQLIIKDIHSEALKEEEKSKIKVYDHRKKSNILAQVNDYIKNSKLGISVFAEDRRIIESLKPYENITSNIINRNNAHKNDVLMFFDYPCSDDVMDNLKQKVCASAIHYMNYEFNKIDEEGILKNFSGMVKYACHNYDGDFVLTRAASAIGVTEEVIEILLEIFEDSGMIKIVQRSEDRYKIEFLSGIEISKVLHSIKYSEFLELMNSVNCYKNNFMLLEL